MRSLSKSITFIILFAGIIATLIPLNSYASKEDARFVWVTDHGKGRNQHVFFRYNVQIEKPVEKAELNMYADSRYILYINGESVSYGPLRAFPENPVYDTYNLADYLKEGDNVIAVMVRNNGTNTYQLELSFGSFIAWGSISDGSNEYNLSTPGNWKALKSKGYVTDAPKMSFATGPMEIYEAQDDPQGWQKPDFDDSEWVKPTKLERQDHWGELTHRDIPFLTHDEHLPHHILWKKPIRENENIYSFRLKSTDTRRKDFNTQKRVFAYTYIYSPRQQNVAVGTWWGEFFLNGEGPLERRETPLDKINREAMTLELNEGWNFFFIKYDIVWASWEFYMALPRDKGLVLSPDKKTDDNVFMRTAGPFGAVEEKMVLSIELPFESPEDLPVLSLGWEDKTMDDHAQNPAWNVAWSQLHEYEDENTQWQTNSIIVPANQPTAVALDMGGKKLGRLFVEFEAPAGTRFDFGFSEDLINGRPWVLKRAGIYTGVGYLSAEGSERFESFQPYGLRYIQLNITGHTEDVKIKRIGVINQTYPFKLNGSFQSSDPMFDDLWRLGWRTLLVCAEDTYTDTPFRERGLYAGDALPQYAITLATSGDSRLIRRSLEVFQDHYRELFFPGKRKQYGTPGTSLDFPMKTLEYFRWYIEMEDDKEFAQRLYPQYQNLLEYYRKFDTFQGLTIFPRVFLEWTKIQKSNSANTAANSLLARSYRNMAEIATYLEETEDAIKYNAWADELTAKILELCWDEEMGAFFDGYLEGEKIDSYYPISSAYPVLFGLTTEEHNNKIREFLSRELEDIGDISRQRKTTPYGGYYVIGALYKLEDAATAERFIRKYWTPMILKHNDTSWENFDDGSTSGAQGTLSHAWSGSPTFYFSTQTLGIPLHFDSYDPDNFIIAPQSENLSMAQGVVPTPKGDVHVEWHISSEVLFVNVDAPEALNWKVSPRGRLANYRLVVNGKHIQEVHR